MKSGYEGSRRWRIDDKFDAVRTLALRILSDVEQGTFLDETIARYFSRSALSDLQKGLIYEIVSGSIRWQGHFDWLLSRFVTNPVKPALRDLLRMGFYQLFFMKKAGYHVVNETVEYAKKVHGKGRADFVNAVLRRALRERGTLPLPDDPAEALSVEYSFPRWLVTRWMGRFARQSLLDLFALSNSPPEFGLRIDLSRISRPEAAERLTAMGVSTRNGMFLESALYASRLAPLLRDPLFRAGMITVQDEASQLAGIALDPSPGDVILDACAGLGTKSLHIRGLCPQARLLSLDRDRTGLPALAAGGVAAVGADILLPPLRAGTFDRILLDPPCSSLGIVRKHPEIKWRRKEEDVHTFSRMQSAMLSSVWPLLKPGGCLVYSVCSFEPDETIEVIDRFRRRASFLLENPLPFLLNKEYFLSLPQEMKMDGFFIAKLRKT